MNANVNANADLPHERERERERRKNVIHWFIVKETKSKLCLNFKASFFNVVNSQLQDDIFMQDNVPSK